MSKARALRCAIYTRKSSEEGLEQDFNSLHAQREACEAFIKSQKHEGWSVGENHYDDGGISGATMERPALQRLLADIKSGKVDVVVVYKVDRLTRALSDFARIVDVFDTAGVSFVSVTQQFNTTTSMGRLTLNVLLSFAQFEREVTGERIRDKIAASRKKGMWMGGNPPLGYDVEERKLIVNEDEAETVRHIFRRYEELGSVRSLRDDLDADGIVGKVRISRSGRCWGGQPLVRGALYRMLCNRVYLGETVHKEKHYSGEHDAIVDQDLWERVQAKLDANRVEHKTGHTARNPSLLAGVLFDDNGDRMTPSHAVKNGKRYRYYISRPLTTQRRPTVPGGRRVPAGDIEQLVADRVRALLSDQIQVFEAIRSSVQEPGQQKNFVERAAELSKTWDELTPADMRGILGALIARVDVLPEKVDIHLIPLRIVDILRGGLADLSTMPEPIEASERLTLSVPARLRRAGMETKMIINGANPDSRKAKPDPSLTKLVVKAYALHEKLMAGKGVSLGDIAKQEGLSGSYFTRVLRLAFLGPDITRAILQGRQPPDLTAAKLTRGSRLPLDWREQKDLLGFV